ncbi:MAG: ATP-binding protein, partial [Gammaproteobacteria bacterium]|nr:ATP-binding protein [Gammaproteobacteria bacterium]
RDFPRMVRDASKKLGKSVDLSLTGVDVLVDRDMLDALVAPLEHIVLNAIDHGIESPKQRMAATKAEYGNISLHAKVVAGMLFINIQDDGQGIDLHQLKQTIALKGLQRLGELDELDDMQVLDYIFTPGFSTRSEASKFSGRGYGLDIVHEVIKSFGGTVHATTALGKGMTIQILLPLNRSLLKSLVVSAGGELYGLPVAKLIHVLKASRKEIHEESGTFYVIYHQTPVPLIHINQILEKLVCADAVKSYSIVLLDTDNGMLGMVVDQVIVEEELLLQQATKFISQLDLVNGVSVNEHGEVILLLDVQSLKTEFQKFKSMDMLDNNWFVDVQTDNRVLNILIADASLTAREVQAKLLRSHGHVVEFATDGEAALQKITDSGFDLLITDLDLPKLDAVSLLRHLRQSVAGNDLPVLIVSDHPLKKLKTIREQNSNVQILPKAMFSKTALLQKLDAIKSFLHNRQQLKR